LTFTPSDEILSTINENVNFSFSITYETDQTTYPVLITALEENPNTVIISENIISGYFYDSFVNTIIYKTKENDIVTVNKFEEIDKTNLSDIVSYKADVNHYKNFTYRADAISVDGSVVIDSKVYTIIVSNDWTEGKENLHKFLEYTIASRN